jgi:hypothetical protein
LRRPLREPVADPFRRIVADLDFRGQRSVHGILLQKGEATKPSDTLASNRLPLLPRSLGVSMVDHFASRLKITNTPCLLSNASGRSQGNRIKTT